MSLTGLVIAQNEERDLPRCLESLRFCDELLVIDGGSKDRTAEVAARAGARVVGNAWPGYAAQRLFGLAEAKGDWILAVDADEWVDGQLRDAVRAAVQRSALAGYLVRVENRLFGRRLRFGGVGRDLHLRLVQRSRASVRSALVHEGLSVDGELGTLGGALIHESYANLTELAQKLDRYSSLGAMDAFAKGRRTGRFEAAARLPLGFLKRYALELGFLDGYPGFVFAAMQSYGDFLKGAKIRELMEGNGR